MMKLKVTDPQKQSLTKSVAFGPPVAGGLEVVTIGDCANEGTCAVINACSPRVVRDEIMNLSQTAFVFPRRSAGCSLPYSRVDLQRGTGIPGTEFEADSRR
ncbi:hypothetical protein [Rhizobium leguminosarum]|uniref:hypothetical protein n=1 Tax=Rhizobium leguminosarum TaxID=384 RepID=UPI001C95598D|nr:hypothetical protein [Rhizobium leguminosarum]MBY5583870.1 hypothetical protein [Rhizobium leguminosarum]